MARRRQLMGLRRLAWPLLSATLVSMVMCLLRLRGSAQDDYRWLEYSVADGNPGEDACDCDGVLKGEPEAVARAQLLSITRSFLNESRVPDERYLELARDCKAFRSARKYLDFPLSPEEEAFPLAFSIVVHHKVHNFERLLRAIYAPQNYYCVHIDRKAPPSVYAAFMAVTSCFDNVFLASRAVEVVYAGWSRVQADINCMSDLYRASADWRYFINLCGQDFPLKTNLEMVRALGALAGANSLESEAMPSVKAWRWKKVSRVVDRNIQVTSQDKAPPPDGLPILSGSAYIVVGRGFVRSVLKDGRVQALIQWSNDTYSPDEFLWATVQRMPGVPGSVRPNTKYDTSDLRSIARLVKWQYHEGEDARSAAYPPCHGSHVRAVCVFGAGDLEWMLQQHHLFANKFDADTDPIAIRCLEKYLRHKALAEIQ